MRISTNISYSEAVRSETAVRKGIENTPNEEQIKAMKLLANKVFEPLREYIREPILATSFYRCEELNKTIKGSLTSQHVKGEAMDIAAIANAGYTNADLFFYIKNNLDFDQLIWEFGDDKNPNWVHVSYSGKANRKEILKASKVNGKTIYTRL